MLIAVIADRRIAAAVGAAVALRRTRRGAVGLVTFDLTTQETTRPPAPPPTLEAARHAAGLRSAGHPARSSWRLVRCDAIDVGEAVAAATRLNESRVPTVVAIPGAEFNAAIVERCDLAIAAAMGEAAVFTSSLAVESLSAAGMASALELPAAGPSTVLPLAGISAPPQWSEPIDTLLESAVLPVQAAATGGRGESSP